MKIIEILLEEPTIRYKLPTKNTNITPKTHKGDRALEHLRKARTLPIEKPKTSASILGNGIEALVFKSSKPSQQGVVTKWIRNQTTDSKRNTTIRYLIEGQDINNTMIPTVYNVTQFKRPNGLFEFSIQMEQLSQTLSKYCYSIASHTNRDDMLIRQIISQVASEQEIDNIMEILDRQIQERPGSNYPRLLIDKICEIIQYPTKLGNKRTQTWNKFLSKVCKGSNNELLANIPILGTNNIDIHGGNIMTRLTSVGIQLVVNDPLIG